MCGLTGYFSTRAINSAEAAAIAQRMKAALSHRGPEDAGAWVDTEVGIALGRHRGGISPSTAPRCDTNRLTGPRRTAFIAKPLPSLTLNPR